MMWHFVEEIEHRSSGLMLYRHRDRSVVPRQARPGDIPSRRRAGDKVAKTFDKVIPFEDRGASAGELMSPALLTREFKYRGPGGRRDGPTRGAPTHFQRRADESTGRRWCGDLLLSQTPYHDPADQPLPEWADTWMREYDRGTDMTTFFGRHRPPERAER